MFRVLDDLRIVALGDLILHEAHDERRLNRLRERVDREGVQRNPVVVSPCDDGYLVLDGAHRVHALGGRGQPFVLVQLTDLPAAAESWAHVFDGPLLHKLETSPDLDISDSPDGIVAEVSTPQGSDVLVHPTADDLDATVRALWAVQSIYPENVGVRRADPEAPPDLSGGEVSVRYRAFAPTELVEIVRSGSLLPAGITRFRVAERVLGVRYPLDRMESGDLDARNAELQEFVQACRAAGRVRLYEEPVVVFE